MAKRPPIAYIAGMIRPAIGLVAALALSAVPALAGGPRYGWGAGHRPGAAPAPRYQLPVKHGPAPAYGYRGGYSSAYRGAYMPAYGGYHVAYRPPVAVYPAWPVYGFAPPVYYGGYYGGYHGGYHGHGHIDGGDVALGALIAGGTALLVSSVAKANKAERAAEAPPAAPPVPATPMVAAADPVSLCMGAAAASGGQGTRVTSVAAGAPQNGMDWVSGEVQRPGAPSRDKFACGVSGGRVVSFHLG